MFVVMLPGSKEKKLTALTGFHTLTTRLSEIGEAILLKDDEGKTIVESGTHDGFLPRGNGRRHEDGASAG